MFELEDNMPSLELSEASAGGAVIKVVGVGGAGGNAVNRMIAAGVKGVEFIAMNTDMQSLNRCLAGAKLQLGEKLTGGKGVGADPEKGRQSAMESEEEIKDLIRGADMLFVAAGMGKGTGTGAAPVVARLGRELGILTIPVVTRPFAFEGLACSKRAEQGLKALREVTDSVLVISNENIMSVAARVPITEAFRQADDTLRHAIQSISDVVTSEGLMNCDFNDVRAIMDEKGGIYMGVGAADGEEAASRAAEMAIENPYLDGARLEGARGLLVMISAKDQSRFSASDLETVLTAVGRMASKETNLIHGLAFNDRQEGDLRVTVIAAGFEAGRKEKEGGVHWLSSLGVTAPAAPDRDAALKALRNSPVNAEDLDIPAFLRRRHFESMDKAVRA